jgi:hypothetical protein
MSLRALPTPVQLVNEALAFLLELVAIAALGAWGFHTGRGVLAATALGLGAPAAAIVLWALFAAPKAAFQVAMPAMLSVKAAVFGGAAAAVYALGHHTPALAFALIALVNTALATIDRAARSRAAH